MQITLKHITIADLVNGYNNNISTGQVVAYGGKLDIRPPYQREFVYKDKQRDAVIETVSKNFPLNVMYWASRDDGTFEVIDGQQRTLSICEYVAGNFSVEKLYFHNLPSDKKQAFLDYQLTVYICTGTDSEKLDWFKIINIAGEKLTDQELRNAVYHGSWLANAKTYFSKTNCPAYAIGHKYLTGSPIRQDYLETALKWISQSDNIYKNSIESYMAMHQHKPTALDLWTYYQNVISWAEATFPNYRSKMMKGLPWGEFYNRYKDQLLDPQKLEQQIAQLIDDNEVQDKRGIYHYLLSGDKKHLNLRSFGNKERQKTYEKQQGICPMCKQYFKIEKMQADHIIPWSKGGTTTLDNCQMLCQKCNQTKSDK